MNVSVKIDEWSVIKDTKLSKWPNTAYCPKMWLTFVVEKQLKKQNKVNTNVLQHDVSGHWKLEVIPFKSR